MDIYKLGETTVESNGYERGDNYVTDIVLNPGEEVYLRIGVTMATEEELIRHRRDLQGILKYLNHMQRIEEELFTEKHPDKSN